MSGPEAPEDTERSAKLERWAGLVVVGSIALMVLVGLTPGIEFLFWVPFAVGIGLVLPVLAILADRERADAGNSHVADEADDGTDDEPGEASADEAGDAAGD